MRAAVVHPDSRTERLAEGERSVRGAEVGSGWTLRTGGGETARARLTTRARRPRQAARRRDRVAWPRFELLVFAVWIRQWHGESLASACRLIVHLILRCPDPTLGGERDVPLLPFGVARGRADDAGGRTSTPGTP